MLYLISLGLKEGDLTLEGQQVIERCKTLYAERYTAPVYLPASNVRMLERKDVEQGAKKLIAEARESDIALLIGGDAMFATTHSTLVLDCMRAHVQVRIIHGPGIMNAVADTGLSMYKFGETVSVPRWTTSYKPSGFYDTILRNRSTGLHTLLLLEPGMGTREGKDLLLTIEQQKKGTFFSTSDVVAMSKAGSTEQTIWVGRLGMIPDLPAPAVLIVPGKLNVVEDEFLDALRGGTETNRNVDRTPRPRRRR